MVTAGLLISLESRTLSRQLLEFLSENEAVFPGERQGSWLPVAVEAENEGALREMHDRIARLPGVAFVDVVHVSFEDPSLTDPTLLT
jgi:hypothetical protein